MTDTMLLYSILALLLIFVLFVVSIQSGFKAKILFGLLGTSYMLVHALLHPASNSKFFAFIGMVFLFQNIRKLKGQNKA